jgi:hypothetical protein
MAEHQEAAPHSKVETAYSGRRAEALAPELDEFVQRAVATSHAGAPLAPGSLSPSALLALQRTAGNQAVNGLLARYNAGMRSAGSPGNSRPVQRAVTVQRHDDNSPIIEESAAAKAETEGGATTAVDTPGSDPGTPDGGTPAPTTPTPAPTPDTGTADTDTPTTTPPSAPAPVSTPTTPTLSFPTMEVAYAQKAIKDAFGTVKGSAVITGNVKVVGTRDELYAARDKVEQKYNPKWPDGGSKASDVRQHVLTNAFAEPPPDTGIYVFGGGPDPTATVHEMLHINAAVGFTAKVGRVINEGITQRLAVAAVKAQGNSVVGSENTYQSEQGIVAELVKLITEDTIKTAYFGGADTLITAYEAKMGSNQFAVLKALLATNDYTGALAILKTPPKPPTSAPTTPAPTTPAPAPTPTTPPTT